MASTQHLTPQAAIPALVRPARLFAMTWIGCVAAAAAAQLVVEAPVLNQETALLALLGFFGCARPIRLGTKLEICIAQPASFAALLLFGASTALLVVLACVLGASVLGRGKALRLIKVSFNMATGAATVLTASAAFLFMGGLTRGELSQELLTVLLVATLLAFLASTVPVALVAAFETGRGASALWVGTFLPAAPAYLAGSGLALLLVLGFQMMGALSLAFFVPLALLSFNNSVRTVAVR